jgi:hypothetical protein
MVFLVIASLTVMAALLKSFEAFIDMTSAIAFIVGPFISWLNHRSMFGGEVPASYQPGVVIRLWSIIGLIFQTLISLYYIYLRIAG